MKPHVTFHLNKRLDKQMIAEFLKYGEKAGFNFAKVVTVDHPELEDKADNRNFIDKYVDDYYVDHRKELLDARKKFQDKWNLVEDNFLNLVDEIFNKQNWPVGKYRGFISIVQCGPRFLETADFQSSFKWEKNLVSQVIHEMLHFQFYETAKKMGLDISEEKIWTLSEIFNDVVQQENSFTKIQGYKVGISYPAHKKEYKKFKKIWEEERDVTSFIEIGLKNLDNKG